MAAEPGRSLPDVRNTLAQQPHVFDFFQAVRIVQRGIEAGGEFIASDRPAPVGYDSDPAREVARFRATQSVTFAGSDVESVRWDRPIGAKTDDDVAGARAQIQVNFLGLTGINGVLPQHYTNLVIAQVRDGNLALRDFLDLFNHRIISLFYRAWEKYRPAVLVESCQSTDCPDDLFSHALACLIGLGTEHLPNRLAIPQRTLLHYSGHLTQRPPNAVSLRCLLADYLGATVSIVQFQGQWLQLEPEVQTQLSARQARPGPRAQLGQGAVIGEQVWDRQSKFRVRVGPVDYRRFLEFVPGSSVLLALCQLVRTYVGIEFAFDVQLILRRDEVPWCTLGENSQLGWNTWIRNSTFQDDVDDAVFCLEAV